MTATSTPSPVANCQLDSARKRVSPHMLERIGSLLKVGSEVAESGNAWTRVSTSTDNRFGSCCATSIWTSAARRSGASLRSTTGCPSTSRSVTMLGWADSPSPSRMAAGAALTDSSGTAQSDADALAAAASTDTAAAAEPAVRCGTAKLATPTAMRAVANLDFRFELFSIPRYVPSHVIFDSVHCQILAVSVSA